MCAPSDLDGTWFIDASHFLWPSGRGTAILPIDEYGPRVVVEAAFDGEQSVGANFLPTASCLTKYYGTHPQVGPTIGFDGCSPIKWNAHRSCTEIAAERFLDSSGAKA